MADTDVELEPTPCADLDMQKTAVFSRRPPLVLTRRVRAVGESVAPREEPLLPNGAETTLERAAEGARPNLSAALSPNVMTLRGIAIHEIDAQAQAELERARMSALPMARETAAPLPIHLAETRRVARADLALVDEATLVTQELSLDAIQAELAALPSLGRAATEPPIALVPRAQAAARSAPVQVVREAEKTLSKTAEPLPTLPPPPEAKRRTYLLLASACLAVAGAVASTFIGPENTQASLAQAEGPALTASMLPSLPAKELEPSGAGAVKPQTKTAEPPAQPLTAQGSTKDEPAPPAEIAPPTPSSQAATETPEKASAEPSNDMLDKGQKKAALMASPEVAADLYVQGRFKEALAEYRMLQTLYPKQPVYGHFARVLARRLIETCRMTQPELMAQCEKI